MFFDYNEVSDNLSCSYCSHRFTDVVKLVPQCGNSICGDCYDAIVEESREFQCKACDHQPHKMPSEGFPNNITVMKMVRMERIEKPLNENTKTLKATIENIQERIDMLQAFDGVSEINSYCDLLEGEVMIASDSSIKHLIRTRDKLLGKISAYRKDLLESLPSSKILGLKTNWDKTKTDLEVLSKCFESFRKEWTDYFVQLKVSRNDKEIEKAQMHADAYKFRLTSLEKTLREQTFSNKFMVFEENQSFTLTSSHLGRLKMQGQNRLELGSSPFSGPFSFAQALSNPSTTISTSSRHPKEEEGVNKTPVLNTASSSQISASSAGTKDHVKESPKFFGDLEVPRVAGCFQPPTLSPPFGTSAARRFPDASERSSNKEKPAAQVIRTLSSVATLLAPVGSTSSVPKDDGKVEKPFTFIDWMKPL